MNQTVPRLICTVIQILSVKMMDWYLDGSDGIFLRSLLSSLYICADSYVLDCSWWTLQMALLSFYSSSGQQHTSGRMNPRTFQSPNFVLSFEFVPTWSLYDILLGSWRKLLLATAYKSWEPLLLLFPTYLLTLFGQRTKLFCSIQSSYKHNGKFLHQLPSF